MANARSPFESHFFLYLY